MHDVLKNPGEHIQDTHKNSLGSVFLNGLQFENNPVPTSPIQHIDGVSLQSILEVFLAGVQLLISVSDNDRSVVSISYILK